MPVDGRCSPSPRPRRLLLALLPGYRLHAPISTSVATLLTLPRGAVAVLRRAAGAGPYLLVDDLNIVFIVLTTFVGFTTSVFSASYIAHELETGRLDAARSCASITPCIRC